MNNSKTVVIVVIALAIISVMAVELSAVNYEIKQERQSNEDLRGTIEWLRGVHADWGHRYKNQIEALETPKTNHVVALP